MANSNRKAPPRKPRKPNKDFPLYAHTCGRWAKKVLGRTIYFTRWADDPKGVAALEEWLEGKDEWLAGREPQVKTDKLTLYQLCNDKFLPHKESQRDAGEVGPRTFADYVAACKRICTVLGKARLVDSLTPDDFRKVKAQIGKTWNAVATRNEIQRIRSIFKFALDDGLIDRPVRYGKGFDKPSLKVVRKDREAHRAKFGDRMFESNELRLILDTLDGKKVITKRNNKKTGEPVTVKLKRNPQLRAVVLLGANCGFGQTDVSSLPKKAVNLATGWIDFPRPKTGVSRKIPLWPETVDAIRECLPLRPDARSKADEGLMFLTRTGARWVRVYEKNGGQCDAVGQEFNKVLCRLGLKRPRVGFYALRHGFETIAGETVDQVAVDSIMGHVAHGMAGVYRERIGADRLQAVTEHVRRWVFALGDNGERSPDTNTVEDRDTLPREGGDQDRLNGGLKLFVG